MNAWMRSSAYCSWQACHAANGRGILGEVEIHVFELLGRRTSGEPTREDVLAVLAQLDPPESYAPEGFDRRMLREAGSAARRREPQLSLMAVGKRGGRRVCRTGAPCERVCFRRRAFDADRGAGDPGGIDRWLLQPGVHPSFAGIALRHASGAVRQVAYPAAGDQFHRALSFAVLGEFMVLAGITIAFVALNGAIIYAAWRAYSTGFQPARETP